MEVLPSALALTGMLSMFPWHGCRNVLTWNSRESFDLIQLRNNPPWTFAPETKVTLPGAHGSEIVRTFCFLDSVSTSGFVVPALTNDRAFQHQTILTCGEDGQIKAWKAD